MIGTKLAHYEITSHLGTGGMGEVYQATDSKLGRSVAIKLLPEAFTHDAERAARFEREARLLASLNHSNIAAIFGLEESGERKFLVMELVDGETLAVRIKRGPIAVEESLQIAKQIVEALEAAHEKGIIHRDLKPANVKITPEGKVKVLDFGLAKAMENSPAGATMSNSPTLSMGATIPGVIIGTAAYMSPEQVRGRKADPRSDVFSFGCVLYEMLTGRHAFQGEEVSDILASVLKSEPDLGLLSTNLNPRIHELLRRCLEKNAKGRWHCAGDLWIEIDNLLANPTAAELATVPGRRKERLAWMAFALITLVAGMAIVRARQPAPSLLPEMRLEITTPPTTDPASLAISPDGLKIAFAATSEGRSRLWIRSLDSLTDRALPGTDAAAYPFWSPDSRSVGFFADGKLKRIDINGGSAQILANAQAGTGGAWNREGVIVFAPLRIGPIFRVSAKGGEPLALTRLGAQQVGHVFPQFLPDGQHFFYYVRGVPETRGIYIGQLDGSKTERTLNADSAAVYASTGQLLFARGGTLFAQDFDPGRRVLGGDPFPVVEPIAIDNNGAGVSASSAGPIVFRIGSAGSLQRQFVWLDRSGKEIEKLGGPDIGNSQFPVLSPDGRRVALSRIVNGNTDVWLLDTGRGVLNRFTFDAASEFAPIWSPDGARIVFSSNRKGVADLYQKLVGGAVSEELLLASAQLKQAADWSSDGRFVLYYSNDPKTGWDLWALPLPGDRKPFPVVQTDFNERDGQFSPDGKWIAYESDESGRSEIYVQPFPGAGGKGQISNNGGAQVRWRRDGKELFYIALDDRLMAAPIRLGSDGQTFEAGAPVPLFATHIGGAVSQNVFSQQYIVSSDGQRFLMNSIIETASPITLLLNWHPESGK